LIVCDDEIVRRFPILLAAAFSLVSAACSDSAEPDGQRVGGSGGDGGATGDAGPVDPKGGRTDTASACFAACQSSSFLCKAKSDSGTTVSEVTLSLTESGCRGAFTQDSSEVAIVIDCGERKVCVGGPVGGKPSDCFAGTFSANSFDYTPTGGALNVCTRQ